MDGDSDGTEEEDEAEVAASDPTPANEEVPAVTAGAMAAATEAAVAVVGGAAALSFPAASSLPLCLSLDRKKDMGRSPAGQQQRSSAGCEDLHGTNRAVHIDA